MNNIFSRGKIEGKSKLSITASQLLFYSIDNLILRQMRSLPSENKHSFKKYNHFTFNFTRCLFLALGENI